MSTPVPVAPARSPLSPAQKALHKLGLLRDIDLALHLPLRYEDETRLTSLAQAREGDCVQIEARVVRSEVSLRPRRQLKVQVDDGSDRCVLRFLNFYPSHQKAFSEGAWVRVRGEVRGGLLGREMVHPSFQPAGLSDCGSAAAGVFAQSRAWSAEPGRSVRDGAAAGLARRAAAARVAAPDARVSAPAQARR
jgi:ATP-dependent DNA helicase RecG